MCFDIPIHDLPKQQQKDFELLSSQSPAFSPSVKSFEPTGEDFDEVSEFDFAEQGDLHGDLSHFSVFQSPLAMFGFQDKFSD